MSLWDKERKPWLHGIISVLLGFFILWTMLAAPKMHHFFVDSVNNVLYFIETPATTLRNIVRFSSNWVLERATLEERVEQLELKNQSLTEALQLASIKEQKHSAAYVSARVTLRYPEEWWSEVRVDKGAAAGVAEGAAATSDGHLVGRVTRVGDSYAWVELITSASFMIAAAVDETRDLGIVNGDGRGNLMLLYVPAERGVKRGMRISTSLMSDQIPPGIPIGEIIAEDAPKEGFLPMRIQAGAHLTQLYSVQIFVGRNR